MTPPSVTRRSAGRPAADPRSLSTAFTAVVAAALALPVLAAGASAFAQTPPSPETVRMSEPPRTLTVAGRGEARGAPDTATVRVAVETQATTAGAALSENSARTARVLAAVAAAGIAARDVQTANVSIQPRVSDYGRSDAGRIVGYTVSNDVVATVRDVTALGGLLDAVVTAGANRIDGIAFSVADDAPLRDAARAAAVEDARRAAERIAAAAGVALGPIAAIVEGGGDAFPRPMMRGQADMAMASVPIAVGESAISATVTIVWTLREP